MPDLSPEQSVSCPENLNFDAPSVVSGGGQNEARIEAAIDAAEAVRGGLIVHRSDLREMLIAAAPFLVSTSDEVTVKREALALFVGFYFDGKGLDVHRAVKLGDITRAGESLRAALNERKEA